MPLRDKIKDYQYFIDFIKEDESRILSFQTKLDNNQVREDRILPVRGYMSNLKFGIWIAKYSMGVEVADLVDDFCLIVHEYSELKVTNSFTEILFLLSIAIMLEVDDETFLIIKAMANSYHQKNWLYDYLFCYRDKSITISDEILFKPVYKYFYKLVNNTDDKIASLKEYLEKRWYKSHTSSGWYEAHKSKENIYNGYWSFESGAIVKILGLDDSELKDVQYYPYDLVHYKES